MIKFTEEMQYKICLPVALKHDVNPERLATWFKKICKIAPSADAEVDVFMESLLKIFDNEYMSNSSVEIRELLTELIRSIQEYRQT